ncbi:MAG: hypothetical protein ACREPM_10275, partial [Gemmatimonadaceae bacterium]
VCARRHSRTSKRRLERGTPALRLLNLARERARLKGVEFALTVADIAAVWPKDGRCPALGICMTQGHRKSHDASPTLDRLNPSWGYVPGNIAVICYAANRAKGAMRAEQLERIAAWMRVNGLA